MGEALILLATNFLWGAYHDLDENQKVFAPTRLIERESVAAIGAAPRPRGAKSRGRST